VRPQRRAAARRGGGGGGGSSGPRMYASRDAAAADAFRARESRAADLARPLEQRAAAGADAGTGAKPSPGSAGVQTPVP